MKQNRLNLCTIWTLVLLLGFAATTSEASNKSKLESLEEAFNRIDRVYPRHRYFRAGASLVTGVLRSLKGINILKEDDPADYEKLAAYMLIGLSSVRIADGVKGLVFKEPVEKEMIQFQNMPANETKIRFGEQVLKQSAKRGKKKRIFRSILRAGTGALYLYLYLKDSNKYKNHVYSGFFYAGFTIYNLLSKSPEEKAWRDYKNSSKPPGADKRMARTQLYLSPIPKGFSGGMIVYF